MRCTCEANYFKYYKSLGVIAKLATSYMARGFLIYLKASAPDTEVPSPGLLPTPRRPTPFLFTPTQITALFEGAQASRPQGSLRPHTLSCLLGLLASTGLRVGEALRLHIDQVKLELDPPQ